MHPILAERSRLGAYVAAWTLLGFLLSALLVLAAPFGWAEAFVFAVPLAVLFGFLGLAAFWVCMASPIKAGLARAVATQLPAAFISGSIWLAVAAAGPTPSTMASCSPACCSARLRPPRCCSGLASRCTCWPRRCTT